ncbi:hypothetical protein [Streptomyces sp. ME19-01-6]|uniref:hypothetical protein n=1 Tax=Streptomyces sp. ME19-01-6 TaxID=3028686 RepID=UPI0039F4C4AA
MTTVPGSAPGGRIVRADVDKAIARHETEQAPAADAAQPAAPKRKQPSVRPWPTAEDSEAVPLSTVRRLTAQRLAPPRSHSAKRRIRQSEEGCGQCLRLPGEGSDCVASAAEG